MKTKSILVLAMLLLFSVKSIAQIQNTFFGNQFGSTFCTVKNNLERQGFTTYSNGNIELSCYDIRFGGHKWSICNFIFNNQSKFYKIELSTPFRDSQTAIQIYEDLKESLQSKYKGCPSSYSLDLDKDDTDRYIDIFDKHNDVKLLLLLNYSESKGGDYFYYVTLTYNDRSNETDYDEL